MEKIGEEKRRETHIFYHMQVLQQTWLLIGLVVQLGGVGS